MGDTMEFIRKKPADRILNVHKDLWQNGRVRHCT